MKLDLPLAPPVNNLFATVRGGKRVRSAKYDIWRKQAGLEMLTQRRRAVLGPFRVEIAVPYLMAGDIDNRIKPVLDLLVEHGLTADDSKAMRVAVSRSAEVEPGRMTVETWPA